MMDEACKTFEADGLTVEIHYDSNPENPRTEWDNMGTMTCFARRYSLGDEHDYREPDALWRDLFSQIALSHQDIKDILCEAVRDKDWRADYQEYYGYRGDEDRWVTREDFIRNKLVDSFEYASKDTKDVVMRIIENNFVILPLYLYDH